MPAKRWAIAYAISAYVIASLGAGLFLLYVVATGAGLYRRESALDGVWPWMVNLGLLLLFALQHSGMARPAFKTWLTQWIPASLERSTYVIVSGVVAGAIPLLWQPLPGEALWHGPIWIIALSIAASIATGLCAAWFAPESFLGYQQASTGIAEVRGPLRIEGPYRYVRHPLMMGLLIALWAQPVMPPELLMLNAGLTVYILIAIRWEERGLVHEFGEEYENYRKRVPGLVPWKFTHL